MKAFVVVDLGFGDAGKGLLTDYLVRRHDAELVVRFNGGAQAGHNVVEPSGRQHTFSQLGSGTFVPGVRTHLASPVVVHPTALRVEAQHLEALGEREVLSRVSIDPACLVTSPFQQAAGRLRELGRPGKRHGSCGVGVGETVADALARPELALRFGELLRPERLRARMEAERARKLAEFSGQVSSPDAQRELELLSSSAVTERWLVAASGVARAVRVASDDSVRDLKRNVVFEGAQGVLLDEDFGFHPFTTWSHCTPVGARELLERIGWAHPVETLGVLRTYAVRHGPGPLPTESALVAAKTSELHNAAGPWQGSVRKGWLDLMLLDYALRASGGMDALAVTHVDALRAFDSFRYCERYASGERLELPRSLADQAKLARELSAVEPLYTTSADFTEQVLCQKLRETTGLDVRYTSTGPTHADVRLVL